MGKVRFVAVSVQNLCRHFGFDWRFQGFASVFDRMELKTALATDLARTAQHSSGCLRAKRKPQTL